MATEKKDTKKLIGIMTSKTLRKLVNGDVNDQRGGYRVDDDETVSAIVGSYAVGAAIEVRMCAHQSDQGVDVTEDTCVCISLLLPDEHGGITPVPLYQGSLSELVTFVLQAQMQKTMKSLFGDQDKEDKGYNESDPLSKLVGPTKQAA